MSGFRKTRGRKKDASIYTDIKRVRQADFQYATDEELIELRSKFLAHQEQLQQTRYTGRWTDRIIWIEEELTNRHGLTYKAWAGTEEGPKNEYSLVCYFRYVNQFIEEFLTEAGTPPATPAQPEEAVMPATKKAAKAAPKPVATKATPTKQEPQEAAKQEPQETATPTEKGSWAHDKSDQDIRLAIYHANFFIKDDTFPLAQDVKDALAAQREALKAVQKARRQAKKAS